MPSVLSLFAALAWLGLGLAWPLPAVAGLDAEALARFDQRFRQTLEARQIPGGAYAIVDAERVLAIAGHGVRRAGASAAVDPATVFRIASVSKTFAATLTAQLVAEGRLGWNDALSARLPSFRLQRAQDTRRLQLQHLLGQSTGIVPYAYDNLLDANQPLERIWPQFRQLQPHCPPGQCYAYQNVVFSLIAPVIEQQIGASYDHLVEQRLLRPLGMADSSLGREAYLAASNRADPHIKAGRGWRPVAVQPGYYAVAPAAGVNASARDLARWLQAQMGRYPQVLSSAVVAQLTQPRVRTARELRRRHWRELLDDAHYGLGWRVYRVGSERLVLHAGWVQGFLAEVAYSPSRQLGLVMLINAEAGVLGELGSGFWGEVLATPAAALAGG